ncbi:Dolichyldiphosphatase [Entamoeba marina]
MLLSLRPVSLAFVLFEEGDTIGHFMGLVSLVHLFIIGGIMGCYLSTLDFYYLYTMFIIVINEIFNYSLKHIINDPRPPLSQNINKGFPSSHAQFICCFVVLILYKILQNIKFTSLSRKFIIITICCFVIIVDFSRWYLNDHFIYQIIAGNVFGLIVGVVALFNYKYIVPFEKKLYACIYNFFIRTNLLNPNTQTN